MDLNLIDAYQEEHEQNLLELNRSRDEVAQANYTYTRHTNNA